jgi:1-acyl-sn-glycerol-3-phosphate acyltransferase
MNSLLSLWAWFELGLVALGGFLIQLLLAPLTLPWDKKREVEGRTFRNTTIMVTRLSPFWHFKPYGDVPARIRGNTVVVGNHESNADVFLVSQLPWGMKWLGKASLFRIPVVGWSLHLAGYIPVERGEADSAHTAMARCKEWLARGMPVMIFPEGTRSETDDLLPFKDGAFRLAIESGAELLPIAISGTRRALPKHSWRFQRAAALVAAGTPIPTKGKQLSDIEQLKGAARQQILALRAKLRAELTPAQD